MPSIYSFLDYREFLKKWIEQRALQTKGLQSKLATAAGVSSTLISRILSGDKHLSSEQALEMGEYMGLNDAEISYLILLVEIGRAGSTKLKSKLTHEAQLVAKKVSIRILNSSQVSEEIKSVFYSSWIYSGIRNWVATPGPHDVNSLSQAMGLPKKVVANAVDFLIKNGLMTKTSKSLQYASSKTHLDADSPYINHHHRNWRHKGIEKMESKNSEHLFFTSPMSLSKKTALEVRQVLTEAIAVIMKKTEPSPSEVTYCLNLDWFDYKSPLDF